MLLAAVLLYAHAGAAEIRFENGFGLRNHNPFLQIFGLPTFESAWVAAPGKPTLDIRFDLANHADAGQSSGERLVIDGETYFLTIAYRARVREWLELGFELPFVAHGDGFMDEGIEAWHELFGLSNSKRSGPGNELNFSYARDGRTLIELSSPASGVGDVRLTAAVPLQQREAPEHFRVSLRATLKLPTGEAARLLGSGAPDLALGVHSSDVIQVMHHGVIVSAFAGVQLLGDSDVLAALQRNTVPYGGVAATWQATERLGITAQLYLQGRYVRSELEELGGKSYQLAVGGNYRPRGGRTILRFAMVEDVSSNATTDFALHFSAQWRGGL